MPALLQISDCATSLSFTIQASLRLPHPHSCEPLYLSDNGITRRVRNSQGRSPQMKLSEKTLELNICAQVSQYAAPKHKLFWFGLTQKQEAKAGFDACTKLCGRLLIFQFKASNRVLKSKQRVFCAPHDQLDALRSKVKSYHRSVYYAFPLVGNTSELKTDPNLLSQTWLVDVASLSSLGIPAKSDGTPRKNGCHNVYVSPGKAVFHSVPIEVDSLGLAGLVQEGFPGSDGIQRLFGQSFERFSEFVRSFSAGARGLVLW